MMGNWGLFQRCWDIFKVCGRAEGSWHGVEVADAGMDLPFRGRVRVGWWERGEGSSASESGGRQSGVRTGRQIWL